jgi:carbonic anhydrase
MTADESRKKLTEGNGRFAAGKPGVRESSLPRIRELSENGQHPLAIIVSCSDSRVPPEFIFDQGLGDLFVVRTAGNVVDDVALGSIEYGAEHLHIPLILVLGHEKCGAVRATVDSAGGDVRGSLRAITDKIKKSLYRAGASDNIYEGCADENIRNTMSDIRNNKVIAGLIHEGRVQVAGAKYGIGDGKVTFFS